MSGVITLEGLLLLTLFCSQVAICMQSLKMFQQLLLISHVHGHMPVMLALCT